MQTMNNKGSKETLRRTSSKTKSQEGSGTFDSGERWASSPKNDDQLRRSFDSRKKNDSRRPSTGGTSIQRSVDPPARPKSAKLLKSRIQDVMGSRKAPTGKENADRFRNPTAPKLKTGKDKKKSANVAVSMFKASSQAVNHDDDITQESFEDVPIHSKTATERLLLGANDEDDGNDEIYTFGSPQITSQSHSPTIIKRSPARHQQREQQQQRSDNKSKDNESSQIVNPPRSKDDHQRKALNNAIGVSASADSPDNKTTRPKDLDLFEAMKSPPNQKKEIKVNHKSSAIIDRANEAARKAQARLGMESMLEEKCTRILAHAGTCLSEHLNHYDEDGEEDGDMNQQMRNEQPKESTAFLLSDCDGSIPLTQGLIGRLVQKPRMTIDLLERPPFRFLHDLVSEITKATGLAEGLFDEATEMDPRNMGKTPRLRYLEKLIVLIDAQLLLGGSLVKEVKASKIVAGLEPKKTNKFLQLLSIAAHINPVSSDAVISILGYTPESLKIIKIKDNSLLNGRRKAQDAKKAALLHQNQMNDKQQQLDIEEKEKKKKIKIAQRKEEKVRKQAQEKARREFRESEEKKALKLEMDRLERVAAEAAAQEMDRLKKEAEEKEKERQRSEKLKVDAVSPSPSTSSPSSTSRLRLELANAVAVDGQLSGRRDDDDDDDEKEEDRLLKEEERHKEAVAKAIADERAKIAKEEEKAKELALKKQRELEEQEKERQAAIEKAVAEERERIAKEREVEKRAREQARQKELDEQKERQDREAQELAHKEAVAKAIAEERAKIASEEKLKREAEERALQLAKQREEEELAKQHEEEERERKHQEAIAAAVAEERANAVAEEKIRKEKELKEKEQALLKEQEEKARQEEEEERERKHKEAIAIAVAEERERIVAQLERVKIEAEQKVKAEMEEKMKKEEEEELKLKENKQSSEDEVEDRDQMEEKRLKQEEWIEANKLAEQAKQQEHLAKQRNDLAILKRQNSNEEADFKKAIETETELAKARQLCQEAEDRAIKVKMELEHVMLMSNAERRMSLEDMKRQEDLFNLKTEAMESEMKYREELKIASELKHKQEIEKEVANAKTAAAEHARELAELKAENALKELEAMKNALSSALVINPNSSMVDDDTGTNTGTQQNSLVQEDNEERSGEQNNNNQLVLTDGRNHDQDDGIDNIGVCEASSQSSMLSSQVTDIARLEANKAIMEEISIERAALAEERRLLEEARQKDVERLQELKKLEEEKQAQDSSPGKVYPQIPRLNFPSPIAKKTIVADSGGGGGLLDDTLGAEPWKSGDGFDLLTTDAETDMDEEQLIQTQEQKHASNFDQSQYQDQDGMKTPTKPLNKSLNLLRSPMTPSGLPPDLLGYIKQLFESHDKDGSGCLDTQEFWWAISSLGLGLSDADILALQSSGDLDKDGAIDWKEFVPVATSLIQDRFKRCDWRNRHENPWIKLHCPTHDAHYYHNRFTNKSEWVTGDADQARRVGVMSIHASPLVTPTTSAAARAARLHARQQEDPERFTTNWENMPSHNLLGNEMLMAEHEDGRGEGEEEEGGIDPHGYYYQFNGSVDENPSVAQSYHSQAPVYAISQQAYQHDPQQQAYQHEQPSATKGLEIGGRVVIDNTPKESLNGLLGEVVSIDLVKERVHVRTDSNNYQQPGKVFAFKMEHVMPYQEEPYEEEGAGGGGHYYDNHHSSSSQQQQHLELHVDDPSNYQQHEYSQQPHQLANDTQLHPDVLLSPKTEMHWELHVDPSTEIPYYVNRDTGDSTWNKPSTSGPPLSPSQDPPPTNELNQPEGFHLDGEPSQTEHQQHWEDTGDHYNYQQQQHFNNPSLTASYSGEGGGSQTGGIVDHRDIDHGFVVVTDHSEGEPTEYFLHTKSGEASWEVPPLHHDPSIHNECVNAMIRWSKIYDPDSASHYWQHEESGHMQWHAPGTHANSATASLHSPMPSPNKMKALSARNTGVNSARSASSSAQRSNQQPPTATVSARSARSAHSSGGGGGRSARSTASINEQLKLQKALNEQLFDTSVTNQDYHGTANDAMANGQAGGEEEEWSRVYDHHSGAHYWLHNETGHTEWEEEEAIQHLESEETFENEKRETENVKTANEVEQIEEFNKFQQNNKNTTTPAGGNGPVMTGLELDTSPVRLPNEENMMNNHHPASSNKKTLSPLQTHNNKQKLSSSPILSPRKQARLKEEEMKKVSSFKGLNNVHTNLDYDLNMNDIDTTSFNNNLENKRSFSSPTLVNSSRRVPIPTPTPKRSPSSATPSPSRNNSSNSARGGGGGGSQLSGRALSPAMTNSGRFPVPRPTPTGSARSARSIQKNETNGLPSSSQPNSGRSPMVASRVPRPSPSSATRDGGSGRKEYKRGMSMEKEGKTVSSMILPRSTIQKNKSFNELDYGAATG